MAMGAAWKLRRIIRNVQHILGIELMCAAQGIDCRRPLRGGVGVETAHATVRRHVETLGDDRVLSGDIIALADAIARGEFQ
jgi:histidine ammonia-lyase